MSERIAFCWSGGKDSSLALHRLTSDPRYEVAALLTTCSEEFRRVSMHGVRVEVARAQAAAIGLPLTEVYVPASSTNDEYGTRMAAALVALRERGINRVAFGDIYLADLRAWREEQLAQLDMTAVFPLWGEEPRELLREFIDGGFRSLVCCVSDAFLDAAWLGRAIDWEFVRDLPPGVDPCGENGEFHSCAFAGPIFRQPLDLTVGERIYRPVEGTPAGTHSAKGFWYCDLEIASPVLH